MTTAAVEDRFVLCDIAVILDVLADGVAYLDGVYMRAEDACLGGFEERWWQGKRDALREWRESLTVADRAELVRAVQLVEAEIESVAGIRAVSA